MFIHNMTESQQRIVDIEDLDYETVKDMLRWEHQVVDVDIIYPISRYIYAGKIENLNTKSPRLLEAADKYQLSELKEICEVWSNIFSDWNIFMRSSPGNAVWQSHRGFVSGVSGTGGSSQRWRIEEHECKICCGSQRGFCGPGWSHKK